MRKIFIFILVFPSLISAQSFRLGFDFAINKVNIENIVTKNENGLSGDGIPLSLHLLGDYKINNMFLMRGKIGGVPLWVEFSSVEFGIDLNYYVYNPIYLSAGYLIHANQGGHGSIYAGSLFATIPMLKLGGGVELSIFEIFAEYLIPFSEKKIYSSLDQITLQPRTYNFKNMIRAGLTFTWGL